MVMPMAGPGTRFSDAGFDLPQPLIPLFGRPMFWWACESLRRRVPLHEMVFVILEEHSDRFDLDKTILSYYPEAVVVEIPDAACSAAESAMIGVRHLHADGPVAVNDCDHAFEVGDLACLIAQMGGRAQGGLHGALMCFPSHEPARAHAELQTLANGRQRVVRTVDQAAGSAHAIGGCYFLASSAELDAVYLDYSKYCPDDARFMRGVLDVLIRRGRPVGALHAGVHRSFGTPDELQAMTAARFAPLLAWR